MWGGRQQDPRAFSSLQSKRLISDPGASMQYRHGMKTVFACAVLVAMITRADAQGVAIIGEGLQSCQAWTDARRNRLDSGKSAWMLGMDGQTALTWVDGYCRDHPASNIASAGIAFVQAHPRGQ
jgi:hypothetical protein